MTRLQEVTQKIEKLEQARFELERKEKEEFNKIATEKIKTLSKLEKIAPEDFNWLADNAFRVVYSNIQENLNLTLKIKEDYNDYNPSCYISDGRLTCGFDEWGYVNGGLGESDYGITNTLWFRAKEKSSYNFTYKKATGLDIFGNETTRYYLFCVEITDYITVAFYLNFN